MSKCSLCLQMARMETQILRTLKVVIPLVYLHIHIIVLTATIAMDVDGTSSKTRSNARKAGRIQKRQKRNRHPVAFRSSSRIPNLAKRTKK